ncbi:SnoaL-like domain-containing protein [Kushneria avicenniae]|uniref:SnoaL-like domain-containing protein n=1 Tax=Kushneria avicenniae TaxID=402385 RepID=A0A1I1G6J2_9GAMM|nr:nuclear transport factor 2 family protein [Kushneria avicenniae]SFC07155.1 SnoaL-like domain-containing protein [Kushneria avicenniae]
MSRLITRTAALDLLHRFTQSWADNDWTAQEAFISAEVALRSDHKGHHQGRDSVIARFEEDARDDQRLALATTNHYVTADGQGHAMVSAYGYGELSQPPSQSPVTAFGLVMRLQLTWCGEDWKIDDILLSVVWAEGETQRLAGWTLPPGQQGWRPGDDAPVMVSELDSPWVAMPDNRIQASEEEKIAETYSRYAWGIDQNDITLFKSTYTPAARGLFPPLGPLNGLHEIVGSLKAFRRLWPWMQHHGEPLKITLADDGQSAEMWVGRRIPGRWVDDDGQRLYGAHYRLELIKEDGLWKFSWSEYVPGWFGDDNMPFTS